MKLRMEITKIKSLFVNNLLTVLLSFAVASSATAFVCDCLSSEDLVIKFEKPVTPSPINFMWVECGPKLLFFQQKSPTEFRARYRLHYDRIVWCFFLPEQKNKFDMELHSFSGKTFPILKNYRISGPECHAAWRGNEPAVKERAKRLKSVVMISRIIGAVVFIICLISGVLTRFQDKIITQISRILRFANKISYCLLTTLSIAGISIAATLFYCCVYLDNLPISLKFSENFPTSRCKVEIRYRKSFSLRSPIPVDGKKIVTDADVIKTHLPVSSKTVEIRFIPVAGAKTPPKDIRLKTITIGGQTIGSELLRANGRDSIDFRRSITWTNDGSSPFEREIKTKIATIIILELLAAAAIGLIVQFFAVRQKKDTHVTLLIPAIVFFLACLIYWGTVVNILIPYLRCYSHGYDSSEIMNVTSVWHCSGQVRTNHGMSTGVSVVFPLYAWAEFVSQRWQDIRVFVLLYLGLEMLLVFATVMLCRFMTWAKKFFVCAMILTFFILKMGPVQSICGEPYYVLFIIAGTIVFFSLKQNLWTVLISTLFAVAAYNCKASALLMVIMIFGTGVYFRCNCGAFFTGHNLRRLCKFVIPYILAFTIINFIFNIHTYLMPANEMLNFFDTKADHFIGNHGGLQLNTTNVARLCQLSRLQWDRFSQEGLWWHIKLALFVITPLYMFLRRKKFDRCARVGLALILASIPNLLLVTLFVNLPRWAMPSEPVFLTGCLFLIISHNVSPWLKILAGVLCISTLSQLYTYDRTLSRRLNNTWIERTYTYTDMEKFLSDHADLKCVWVGPDSAHSDLTWMLLRQVNSPIVSIFRPPEKYKRDNCPELVLWCRQKSFPHLPSAPKNFRHIWFDNEDFIVVSNQPKSSSSSRPPRMP